MTEYQKATETVKFLKSKGIKSAEVGIILGSGLAGFIKDIQKPITISYKLIPNFPAPTVKGHPGNLVYGTLENKLILVMQGRFHYYEGYTTREITFPIRVMELLGVKVLIVTNASGGVNPNFKSGQLMLIKDHINFIPDNPLRGPNEEKFGVRFPSMHNAYDHKLFILAQKVGQKITIPMVIGVYLALPGPNLETHAEYHMARILGADAVGMSTTPEVIVANHMGIKVLGISIITNVFQTKRKPTTHEEVLNVAQKAEIYLSKWLKNILPDLNI